jgi:hypothetical protein
LVEAASGDRRGTLMLGAAASALASRSLGPQGQLAIIGGWAVLYAALFIAIERRVRQAEN